MRPDDAHTPDLVRATENACGEVAETTVVSGEPKVVTQVSAAQVSPGSQIKDSVIVSGSGVLQLTIDVQLFGPFANRSGINCNGTPAWTGTVSSKGDGVYETQPVTLEKVGYYTYRESIAATTTSAGFAGKCGETSETTLAAGKPTVTTIVSNDVVRPGGSIYDRILVSGLGQTEAAIDVKLYGPFATKAAISCTGKPYWQGRVTAQGDGELHSPAVRIAKAGFYTFHETLIGRDHVESVTTECGVSAETSLGAPAIITGRGDHTRVIATASAGSSAPTRVKIPSLNIDVPVVASGIDIAHGILGVPADIHKTGWWSDGAAPGDPTGSVVIAGHVDSAAAGPGAFYNLKNAKAGALITVTTANGATKTYKVTSVRTMLKADLSRSTSGRRRARTTSSSSPAVGRSTVGPGTTATTSSSPQSPPDACLPRGAVCGRSPRFHTGVGAAGSRISSFLEGRDQRTVILSFVAAPTTAFHRPAVRLTLEAFVPLNAASVSVIAFPFAGASVSPTRVLRSLTRKT